MKNILMIVVILNFTLSISAQDRINDALPKITDINRIIEDSTGWLKNPEGQWISRHNRIPSYVPAELSSLIDFEDTSLGLDNFVFLKLYEIGIENKEYYLFIKAIQEGYYKYKSIREEWNNYNVYNYFIIEKEKFDTITINKNAIVLNKIPAIYAGSLVHRGEITEAALGNLIKNDITNNQDQHYNNNLLLNTMYYEKDNVVRFLILSGLSLKGDKNNVVTYYKGIPKQGQFTEIPGKDKSIFIKPEVFEMFYCEVPAEQFIEFFKPINIQ
jgi:hypothetical protein